MLLDEWKNGFFRNPVPETSGSHNSLPQPFETKDLKFPTSSSWPCPNPKPYILSSKTRAQSDFRDSNRTSGACSTSFGPHGCQEGIWVTHAYARRIGVPVCRVSRVECFRGLRLSGPGRGLRKVDSLGDVNAKV